MDVVIKSSIKNVYKNVTVECAGSEVTYMGMDFQISLYTDAASGFKFFISFVTFSM